jgi:hypothetical protein
MAACCRACLLSTCRSGSPAADAGGMSHRGLKSLASRRGGASARNGGYAVRALIEPNRSAADVVVLAILVQGRGFASRAKGLASAAKPRRPIPGPDHPGKASRRELDRPARRRFKHAFGSGWGRGQNSPIGRRLRCQTQNITASKSGSRLARKISRHAVSEVPSSGTVRLKVTKIFGDRLDYIGCETADTDNCFMVVNDRPWRGSPYRSRRMHSDYVYRGPRSLSANSPRD